MSDESKRAAEVAEIVRVIDEYVAQIQIIDAGEAMHPGNSESEARELGEYVEQHWATLHTALLAPAREPAEAQPLSQTAVCAEHAEQLIGDGCIVCDSCEEHAKLQAVQSDLAHALEVATWGLKHLAFTTSHGARTRHLATLARLKASVADTPSPQPESAPSPASAQRAGYETRDFDMSDERLDELKRVAGTRLAQLRSTGCTDDCSQQLGVGAKLSELWTLACEVRRARTVRMGDVALVEELKAAQSERDAAVAELIEDAKRNFDALNGKDLGLGPNHLTTAIYSVRTECSALKSQLAEAERERGLYIPVSPALTAPQPETEEREKAGAAEDRDATVGRSDSKSHPNSPPLLQPLPAPPLAQPALELIDAPCADALEKLWQDIIVELRPNYGAWEYPGQACRHIKAEWDEMRAALAAAREESEARRVALIGLLEHLDSGQHNPSKLADARHAARSALRSSKAEGAT